ncbi:MAG TPA: DUF3106 domain-containing protein [Verrucomicrobiae bacterium]|nr:DUF3106 domain-containing protein [Verrucomicrobiae bacterium]
MKLWWLVLCAAGPLAALPLHAENSPNPPAPIKLLSAPTNSAPRSPVEFFRQLLAMSPDERENALTNKPPEIRQRILAKVAEYEALDPDERELRLRATELRWYLMPLLRAAPTNRATLLAAVPDDLRPLVQGRLEQWIILPPPLQQEFLDNEHVLLYFATVDSTEAPPPPDPRQAFWLSNADQARWAALTEAQRREMINQFQNFFDLTPDEKQEALNTLSDAERAQMEKTLKAFGNLTADQRDECIRAFAKFSGMSAAEKEEFLKNAERWSQMTPKERQTWRDLVNEVPEWPPLPPGFTATLPTTPTPPPPAHDAVATN